MGSGEGGSDKDIWKIGKRIRPYDGKGKAKGARGKDKSGEERRKVVGMKGRVGMEEGSGMEGRIRMVK